ncbi:L-threonine dehydratase biosynthetic IlvA [Diplonema papillatum]|nr:L-threonine dehydratase biosynthetic IlvA [Diplonema papillatum]|eukprot:gene6872-10539_t
MPEKQSADIGAIADHSEAALRLIERHIRRTPLMPSFALQKRVRGGADDDDTYVHLKLESEQVTNSFKARGAVYKAGKCKERGTQLVTTASTGNHALAMVHALRCYPGMRGLLCLPSTASPAKVQNIKDRCTPSVSLEFHGTDCMEAELAARRLAESSGESATFISPYNDIEVIIGQSTLAVEILEDCPKQPDYVLLAVGGGGMISGVAAYFKKRSPATVVVGCQPANDAAMLRCVEAGKIVEIGCRETLSDGTAGNVEAGSVTLPYCAACVDRWVVVSEEEIADALLFVLDKEGKLIEGSAAVAVAALLREPETYRNKTSVVVVCGGNVGSQKLQKIIELRK